ncbi:hypothetical protein M0R45_029182 [Rubus argutus]|uniref:MHC class I antigen n=1 Tax=Rubus argutus TaxID=59490 RepID=A0AAW1W7S2_RUBAR
MEWLRSAAAELGLGVGASMTARQWLWRRDVEEDCIRCNLMEEGLQRLEWVSDGDERGGQGLVCRRRRGFEVIAEL